MKYLVRVMGAEHVAIGSDFEGEIRPPAELADVRGLPALGGGAACRGHAEKRRGSRVRDERSARLVLERSQRLIPGS